MRVDKGFGQKGKECKGGKKSKQRVTVACVRREGNSYRNWNVYDVSKGLINHISVCCISTRRKPGRQHCISHTARDCHAICVIIIPYSGKFPMGADFRDFRCPSHFCENLNLRKFQLEFNCQ